MIGRDAYFQTLSSLLKEVGRGIPRLVIDLERIENNIDRLLELHRAESVRIVAKSLPCPTLLRHIFSKTGHERLMVFHLPFLLQLVEHFPGADVLMGKPLPVTAMRHFYSQQPGNLFDDSSRLQWLVDTEARLRQVAGLARELGRRISVSIELDVGMHRGGARHEEELGAILEGVREFREEIRLAGFMGYDAHVPKAPFPRSVAHALERSKRRYTNLLDFAWTQYPDLEEATWCINGAGSPTIAMHDESSPLNDVSIGSALVKPTAFDLPPLKDFEPAAWIAAPVLKRLPGIKIPFIERMPSHKRDTLFIYGGKWMAEPCWPDGLRENPVYGRSSNQQMLTVPAHSGIEVDDYVFLRPAQSEAVLLQFGDLCILHEGKLVDRWPVLESTGY